METHSGREFSDATLSAEGKIRGVTKVSLDAQSLLRNTSSAVILALFRRVAIVWTSLNFLYLFLVVGCCVEFFSDTIEDKIWVVHVGKSTLIVFVVCSLLSFLFASDWALTLDYHELHSRIVGGVLVCACSSAILAFTTLDMLQRCFSEYPLFVMICYTSCMKFFLGYVQQQSNQIVLRPAPFDITNEFKKSLRKAFQADFTFIVGEAVITECTLISVISSSIFLLFRMLSVLDFNNIPIIAILVDTSNVNSIGFGRFVWFSTLLSFFVCSVLRMSTRTLKMLSFHPMNFCRLSDDRNYCNNLFRAVAVHDANLNGWELKDPSWKALILAQQRRLDMFLSELDVDQCYGFPKLPYFRDRNIGPNMIRLLAWQDFERSMRYCKHRREMVFSEGCDGILFEAASLLNAVTLQIQLVIAHIAVEIFDPSNYPNPEKKGHFLPFGPVSESWNVHMNWRVVGKVRKIRSKREETRLGRFCLFLSQVPFLGYSYRRLIGTYLVPNPIPKAIIQEAIHASEGISCIFSQAPQNSSGLYYKNLPMILVSLLGLETAVFNYKDIMGKYKNYRNTEFNLFINGKLYSEAMSSLSDAIDQALERVVNVYHDVICSLSLPPAYGSKVSERLHKFKKM